jgi:hypothetical protein
MIVMNLDVEIGCTKNGRHPVAAKLAVEKESQFFTLLRRD